jgi:signal transduction histidine kinase
MDEETRVLFLAPTRKDADVGRCLMEAAGIPCRACDSLADVGREIPLGAGAVVLPEEAVLRNGDGPFTTALRDQPPWSHLPVLILTESGRRPKNRVQALLDVGEITLLKRPLEVSEFIHAIRAALRDRARQYQVRDYVEQQERQAEALREADRRKDDFLAMLAHELRNPLAPIRNGLEILRLSDGDADSVRRTQAMMHRQVEHLSRLVDDLLDVSRITRGKAELRLQPIDLKSVLTRAVETVRPLIDARKHRLVVSQPTRPVWISGDLARMTQVVANLLTNAAKYSENDGHIDLVLEEDESSAFVTVRDTGVGIPTEMLPRVFDLFTQLGRTLDRSDGGLGIGLTLVKSLVEMHGGSVSAASEGPGRGSEFAVRLPKLQASGRPDTAAPAPLPSPESLRILVVDDNPDAGDSLAEFLGMLGHRVQVLRSGMEALEVARSLRPDVALLDIGLPGISGYDLARQLRSEPFGERIRLIALTGYGQDEDRRQSIEAGFDHHLTKPADPVALAKLLRTRPVDE